MSDSLRIELRSDRSDLTKLSQAVEVFGEDRQWPLPLLFKVQLVLEEVVLNSMTHGRRSSDGKISVEMMSDSEAVSIEVSDNGVAFDPLSDAPQPDLDAVLEDRMVGGLGIHLVLEMLDEVNYQRCGEHNRLRMLINRD